MWSARRVSILTSRTDGRLALARPIRQPFRQPSQPTARQIATTTGAIRPRMALSYQRQATVGEHMLRTTSGADSRVKSARVLSAAFLVAATGGVVGAGWLAFLPVSKALGHFVIEDTGYYLSTARNLALGRGITLDGENPTNGFHPLWLVILAVVERAFHSD